MEFKNGYRLLYQRAKDIYASKKNIPTIEDEVVDTGLTEEEKKNIKLVYETKEGIIVNFTGLPTVDDKPIELTAGGEVVVGPSGDDPKPANYKPFEIGQVLKVGDKIHFDISKEAELLEHLESLDWSKYESMGAYPMLGAFAEHTMVLGAMRIPEDEHGVNFNYLLICGTAESMVGVVYIKDGMPGVLESGWHGLDVDGNITLNEVPETPGYIPNSALPVTIDTLYDKAEPHWNGSIVSYVVPEPGPTPPTPSLTPIEIGQHLVEGTKIHFNTSSEDNFLSMLKSLTYEDWQNGLQKSVLASIGTDEDEERKLDWLWAMKIPKELVQTEEDIYILNLGDSESDGHTIYLSAYVQGMGDYVVGFNNLDSNGDFTMSVSSGYYIVNGLYGSGWNGTLIGMGEQPQPGPTELAPFEVGQVVAQIVIDPNAKSVSYLDNFVGSFSGDHNYLVDYTGSPYSGNLIDAADAEGFMDLEVGLAAKDANGNIGHLIYITQIYSEALKETGMNIDPGFKLVIGDAEAIIPIETVTRFLLGAYNEKTEEFIEQTATITNVASEFGPLNGTVFGAIIEE